MLTNEIASDIEKIVQTQPDPVLDPSGGDYHNRADIPKKLSAFEKLVRHAMSRFSNDRVFDLLRFVSNELRLKQTLNQGETNQHSARADNGTGPQSDGPLKDDSQNGSQTPEKAEMNGNNDNIKDTGVPGDQKKPSVLKITALSQIREFMEDLESKHDSETLTDKQARAIKQYDMFRKDITYLKDASEYFDKSIHWRLLEDFYDPDDGFDFKIVPTRPPKTNVTPTPKSDLFSDSPRTSGRLRNKKKPKQQTTESDPTEDPRYKLGKTVWGLKDVLNKWTNILQEKDLSIKDFDPDSQYELAQYNCSSFELALRVVPDIFTKCYKAVDLAREWLKFAEEVYKGRLPLRTVHERSKAPSLATVKDKTDSHTVQHAAPVVSPETAAKQYQHDIKELESKMQTVSVAIKRHETELVKLTAEMGKLQQFDDRVDRLSSTFENMDEKILSAQKEYSKCLYEREQAVDEIDETASGTMRHLEIIRKARDLDLELSRRQGELSVLDYQKSMIQEDYLLELELRPNFIYFMGDVQTKILDIKSDMSDKASEKAALEEQLTAMKTNTSRMRDEMKQYISSPNTPNDMDGHNSAHSRILNGHTVHADNYPGDTDDNASSISDDVDLSVYLNDMSARTGARSDKQTQQNVQYLKRKSGKDSKLASNGSRQWYHQGSKQRNDTQRERHS